MLPVFRTAVLLLLAGVAAQPPAAAGDGRLLKALDLWLKTWRSGKLAVAGQEAQRALGDDAISIRMKVLPAGTLGRLTARRELEILVQEVAALQSPEAAEALLDVAAAGLDQVTYTPQMAPGVVRAIGEKGLSKLESTAAKSRVLEVAKGEVKAGSAKDHVVATRAAALRALGALGSTTFRTALEQQLGAGEARLRLAAVEGLRRLGSAASAEPLARLLAREPKDDVLEAAARALGEILARHQAEVPAPVQQLAVEGAVAALGHGTWRADLALVDFLERFRSAASIPPLIDVLQRFVDRPADIRSGELSGLLRHRAQEALIALTGARFPIDRPDQWREFWEREQATFELAKGPAAGTDENAAAGTVSTGFFGIPVRGTRVLFVIDLSGSMNFDMTRGLGTAAGGKIPDRLPTRLDRAKEALIRAVEGLPEVTSFNLISFDGRREARFWQKDLIPATSAHKKRFAKFVEELQADGGTNTWAGLQEALEMKTFVYGKRYEMNVDEVFVLSDGMPSVGEVVDAAEILRLVAETNRFAKIRINTAYIADELSERDQLSVEQSGMSGVEFMRRLAEQNGGVAVEL